PETASPLPPFLAACRREPSAYTPVWLMRQAGRYMPEYRAVRARLGFLELCHNPEAAAEVTVTAATRLGVDAAIIFADILLVLEPMGVGVEFTAGDGPRIHRPVRAAADVERLRPVEAGALDFVGTAIAYARRALPAHVPLIEVGASHAFTRTRAFLLADPGAFAALMERLTAAVAAYLRMQIAAGAAAV